MIGTRKQNYLSKIVLVYVWDHLDILDKNMLPEHMSLILVTEKNKAGQALPCLPLIFRLAYLSKQCRP